MHLMRKLDTNKDGAITYLELAEGLRDMGIKGRLSSGQRSLTINGTSRKNERKRDGGRIRLAHDIYSFD